MAIALAWAWGADTVTDLQGMGWTFAAGVTSAWYAPGTTYQYVAPGAPSGHSAGMSYGTSMYASPPAKMQPANAEGSIQVVTRISAGLTPLNWPIVAAHISTYNKLIAAYAQASGAVALYVDSVYKSTSASAYDFTDWRTICIFYDFTGATWKGRIEVDGAESNAEATDAAIAIGSGGVITTRLYPYASGSLVSHFGMCVVRDTYAESAPVGRYATIIQVDSDVGARTTGTWTPDTGSDSFARVNENPLNTSNYTEEASPTASDVLTCGFTANLASKLGFSPGTIDAVACYSYSTGLNNTAKAGVGDGSSVTHGSTETIGSGTTLAGVIAEVKPSTSAAWSGSDTPEAAYTLVSI